MITYTFGQLDEVNAAAARFSSEVTDPKAGIITTYNFLLGQVSFDFNTHATRNLIVFPAWCIADSILRRSNAT